MQNTGKTWFRVFYGFLLCQRVFLTGEISPTHAARETLFGVSRVFAVLSYGYLPSTLAIISPMSAGDLTT